jgi:hypothetical protein
MKLTLLFILSTFYLTVNAQIEKATYILKSISELKKDFEKAPANYHYNTGQITIAQFDSLQATLLELNKDKNSVYVYYMLVTPCNTKTVTIEKVEKFRTIIENGFSSGQIYYREDLKTNSNQNIDQRQ